ncbi:response regulator [Nitrospira sp. NS4]|uniref:response regulator n=1 Tax=Nitrospira sp. NS4 TaxID=3414498 RepID=UPI003C2C35CC
MTRGTFDRKTTHAQENPETVEPTAKPRRILVIDHDDQTRLEACHRLTQWGFDAVGETNALSGLALLAQATPDRPFAGMLLELDMPVLGGMAVLQEMKDRHPVVPVLVMAEARHIEKLRGAVIMWAREYIVKPFNTELLKMKCDYVFADSASEDLRRTIVCIQRGQIDQ